LRHGWIAFVKIKYFVVAEKNVKERRAHARYPNQERNGRTAAWNCGTVELWEDALYYIKCVVPKPQQKEDGQKPFVACHAAINVQVNSGHGDQATSLEEGVAKYRPLEYIPSI
jgi:hypothetical protein